MQRFGLHINELCSEFAEYGTARHGDHSLRRARFDEHAPAVIRMQLVVVRIRHQRVNVEERTAFRMTRINPLHRALEAFGGKNIEQDHCFLSRRDTGQLRRLVKTPARQQLTVVARLHERRLRSERQTDHGILFENNAIQRRADFLRWTAYCQWRDAQQRLVALHMVAELGQEGGDTSGEWRGDARVAFGWQDEHRGHFQSRRDLDDPCFDRL